MTTDSVTGSQTYAGARDRKIEVRGKKKEPTPPCSLLFPRNLKSRPRRPHPRRVIRTTHKRDHTRASEFSNDD